jgi:hypothetical protein
VDNKERIERLEKLYKEIELKEMDILSHTREKEVLSNANEDIKLNIQNEVACQLDADKPKYRTEALCRIEVIDRCRVNRDYSKNQSRIDDLNKTLQEESIQLRSLSNELGCLKAIARMVSQ